MRLRSAVRETMAALHAGEKAGQGVAAPEAYERLRAEALAIVPDDKAEEFGHLFPEWTGGKVGRVGMHAVPLAEQALAMLGQLAGWLDGFVEEARLAAEAQAYAVERVRQERGVGFRGAGTPPGQ